MGGQAFAQHGLAIDMCGVADLSVDEERRTLDGGSRRDVGSGAAVSAPAGSVRLLDARAILTVGGSVPVNAHGTDHRSASTASTVRSEDVMLADGRLVHVDRTPNGELF